MPKAILELEMPESCKECKLGHYDELYGLTHCDILRECMPYEGRHKACPLKLVDENAIAVWNSSTSKDINVITNADRIRRVEKESEVEEG